MFMTKLRLIQKLKLKNSTKVVSDLDKFLKPIVVREAIQIVRNDKIPKDSVFEQVFPPVDYPEDYKDFTIYNDIRVLFEILAGFRKPDVLTLSQFQKISYFPGMKADKLSKPEYAILFGQFAKRGNKSLMTIENFTSALEYICKLLKLGKGLNPRPLVKKLLSYAQSKPYY